MRQKPDFEWLEHMADIRVRVRGVSEADLYASAALTMSALMVERPADSEVETEISVVVTRSTIADRLMELLRELLFRFDVDGELLVSAGVELDGASASLRGKSVIFDPDRHVGLREIKAVTYHKFEVGRENEGWWAEIVFDV